MPKVTKFGALSQKDLALLHNVGQRSIHNWDTAGHPRNADGSYDAVKSIAWRLSRELHDGWDVDAERARLARAQSEKAELDLQVRRGTVLERTDVLADVGLLLSAMRARMRGLAARLAPELSTPETYAKVRALIAGLVDEALLEISNEKFVAALAEGTGAPDGTTTQIDDQRMGGSVPHAKQRKQRRARTVAHKSR